MSDMGKNIILWLVILAVLLTVFSNFSSEPSSQQMSYSDFVKAVSARQIREAQIQGDKIYATASTGNRLTIIRSITTSASSTI